MVGFYAAQSGGGLQAKVGVEGGSTKHIAHGVGCEEGCVGCRAALALILLP